MESADVFNIAESAFDFLTMITIFAFVIVLVWLNKHYRARRAQAGSLAADEKQALEDLMRLAEKMDQRLVTLEKILDAEDPKWRDRAA